MRIKRREYVILPRSCTIMMQCPVCRWWHFLRRQFSQMYYPSFILVILFFIQLLFFPRLSQSMGKFYNKVCVLLCMSHLPFMFICCICTPDQWRTQEFCSGGGSTNSVEDRENGDLGGGSPLVRGSGGSCNLVQEISFHMVRFS